MADPLSLMAAHDDMPEDGAFPEDAHADASLPDDSDHVDLSDLASPRPTRARAGDEIPDLADLDEADLAAGDGSAALRGIFNDPEALANADAEAEEFVRARDLDDAELAAVESMELTASAKKKHDDFHEDAFEEWVQLARKYPKPLTEAQTDALITTARNATDPLERDAAESLLYKHNVRWIVKCLRKYAGEQIMDYPSLARDDVAAAGRMGLFIAIRHYNPQTAADRGVEGQKKTFIKYAEYWIAKFVKAHLAPERSGGLKQTAWEERGKVLAAQSKFARKHKRQPSVKELEEFMLAEARAALADKGIADPDLKELRRNGAFVASRIDFLLNHSTSQLSLDTPAPGSEDDGRTLKDQIANTHHSASVGADLERKELELGLLLRIETTESPWMRELFRMTNGLLTQDGKARYPEFNTEEVGLIAGRTRDSIATYDERIRRLLMGEDEIAVDRLIIPGTEDVRDGKPVVGTGVSLGALQAMETVPDALRQRLLNAVTLPALMAADGVVFDPRDPEAMVPCAFTPGASEPAMIVRAQGYLCTCCGKRGDALTWLTEKRGMSQQDALLTLGMAALQLPESALQRTGATVTVIGQRDPVRKRKMRQLK